MFKELETHTVAIHIAQRTWEGEEWRDALHLRGLSDVQIDCLVSEAEQQGRGVVAGECAGVDMEELGKGEDHTMGSGGRYVEMKMHCI